ncbi:MAG: deoxyribodipyrimidine photolyase [Nanohaloarchaea archaeon QH_8_44_6]|nr:MAG: deoxyribodipyrimidine photolyase [Nanohaloarchaea archaeon QH_8_44_6]
MSDQRIEFVLESLRDLNRQYTELGTHLTLLHGDPERKLEELSETHEVFFNRDANHFRQKREERLRTKYMDFSQSPATEKIERGLWEDKIADYFDSEPYKPDESLEKPLIRPEVTIGEIKDEYRIQPDKKKFGEGGRAEALDRLESFKKRMENYSGAISSPSRAESSTSHLSPYIRYGCLSVREIYQELDGSEDSVSRQMFLDRITWQKHFQRKIEANPELFEEAINPAYRDLNRENYSKDKIEAWKKGRTGFPLIDASMRALKQTGWLNFRMRAMCASFFSYILKQWWKIGADHYYRHLVDSDAAINYYQWQMQSGLIGVHANRIYNPTKQVEENDPEGRFIRKYVPELRQAPDEYIAEPWKMPERAQKECGVRIGRNYPEPIVDYEREAGKARKFFRRKAPEAYSAFEDDKIWEKACLSSKHDRDEILEKAGVPQSGLEKFT